ncbi:MAG: hypothetical protein J0L62_08320 [Bacteroidetes bacterium]|nr:hypothetical protein [Bacteroidota bacterium]
MKSLFLLLFLAGITQSTLAQNSMYVENGYLVIHVKLDERLDMNRLAELLNAKSPTAFLEVEEILLTYQDYYRLSGQNSPDWISKFKENLRLIDRLNRTTYKPEQIGNLSIRYDLLSKQVTDIGDMEIRYDLQSKKISQVGDISLRYDGISGKIVQIGTIRIEYDPFNGGIRSLGEFDLK